MYIFFPGRAFDTLCLFFFCSAWIPEENIYLYAVNRNKFKLNSRIPKGYKEALEAIEDEVKAQPATVRFIGSRTKAPPPPDKSPPIIKSIRPNKIICVFQVSC